MGLQLGREDPSPNMHRNEIGMIQIRDGVNSIPVHWVVNLMVPARSGMMRGKGQVILLTGQALTSEESLGFSEMLISKHAS